MNLQVPSFGGTNFDCSTDLISSKSFERGRRFHAMTPSASKLITIWRTTKNDRHRVRFGGVASSFTWWDSAIYLLPASAG